MSRFDSWRGDQLTFVLTESGSSLRSSLSRVRLPAKVPSVEPLESRQPLCSVGEEPPREPHKLETLVRLQPLHPFDRLRFNRRRARVALIVPVV
ncbi:MAG: hypothetical protein BGO98_15575 [Myxococcales bacterium 68-20]|nr:MAG: hypothetical protein BGO98_15575 [Myxococcales bacterium 68-20]